MRLSPMWYSGVWHSAGIPSETNFTKSEGKTVLYKPFFENDPILSTSRNRCQCHQAKKVYLFRKSVKNAEWWSKWNLPPGPLTLQTATIFKTLFKGNIFAVWRVREGWIRFWSLFCVFDHLPEKTELFAW